MGSENGNDVVTWLTAYGDKGGGLVCVEYHGEPLTIAQAGALVANILRDAIGDAPPDPRTILEVQMAITGALQGDAATPTTKRRG